MNQAFSHPTQDSIALETSKKGNLTKRTESVEYSGGLERMIIGTGRRNWRRARGTQASISIENQTTSQHPSSTGRMLSSGIMDS